METKLDILAMYLYPYAVALCLSEWTPIFCFQGEFETIMKKVLGAPSMKSLAEKILKVWHSGTAN